YVQKGAPAEVAFTQPGIQEVEEAKEFIVRCRFRIQMIEQPSHPYLVTLLEIGDAEIVFGWEVIVKCVLRHAGFGNDLIDARGEIPLTVKQVESGVDDALPCLALGNFSF